MDVESALMILTLWHVNWVHILHVRLSYIAQMCQKGVACRALRPTKILVLGFHQNFISRRLNIGP